MQKMILAIAMVSLIAAGCSSQQNVEIEAEKKQSAESSKVDEIIEDIDASLVTEEHLSTQTEADIISSDKEIIINGSEEVSNAAQN
jgi:uncharacterized protein YcfL